LIYLYKSSISAINTILSLLFLVFLFTDTVIIINIELWEMFRYRPVRNVHATKVEERYLKPFNHHLGVTAIE